MLLLLCEFAIFFLFARILKRIKNDRGETFNILNHTSKHALTSHKALCTSYHTSRQSFSRPHTSLLNIDKLKYINIGL
jgi:hypothetical protein